MVCIYGQAGIFAFHFSSSVINTSYCHQIAKVNAANQSHTAKSCGCYVSCMGLLVSLFYSSLSTGNAKNIQTQNKRYQTKCKVRDKQIFHLIFFLPQNTMKEPIFPILKHQKQISNMGHLEQKQCALIRNIGADFGLHIFLAGPISRLSVAAQQVNYVSVQ